ncbi:MAG TPA: hypothetical protein VFE98_01990 [Candidatus Bathyarchaeia archaeon]|nr:hypothetical protein [Candidatus Bathyarchaeia archaeon]
MVDRTHIIENWRDYCYHDERRDEKSGVIRVVAEPHVLPVKIVQRTGCSYPTARAVADYVNFQLQQKHVKPMLVEERKIG